MSLLDVFSYHGRGCQLDSEVCIPWAVSLEQFAINSARQQFVSGSVQREAKDVYISSVVDNNEHHLSLMRRYVCYKLTSDCILLRLAFHQTMQCLSTIGGAGIELAENCKGLKQSADGQGEARTTSITFR